MPASPPARKSDATRLFQKCLCLGLALVSSFWLPLHAAEVQKVQPPDDGRQFQDSLGSAMAMSTEWVIAGAPDDSCGIAEGATGPNGFQSGSAYLFRLITGTWTYQTKLRAPVPKENGRYGRAVALQGSTMAIASNRHPTQANAASVHVYALSGNDWVLQQELLVPGEITTAPVLALDGNMLLVANPTAGAVHAFERSGQTWTWKGNLAENFAVPAGSNLGAALALSGNRAFVGAPGGSQVPGAIYELGYSLGAWSLTRTLPSPAGNMYDRFGRTVVWQNGFLVAGARVPSALQANPPSGSTAGRVYIFADNGSAWTLARTIDRPQVVTALEWGNSITPGTNRVIIGADVSSGDNKAFFHSLEMVGSNPSSWTLAPLPPPARSLYWSPGSVVASSGNTLLRGGGPNDISSGTSNWYADRFTFAGSAWTAQGILEGLPWSQLQSQRGYLVPAGNDVVLTTPRWNRDSLNEGIVHVFGPVNGRWQLKQTLNNPAPYEPGGRDFGHSAAYGKELDKLAITSTSRIYIYRRAPGGSWTLQTTFAQSTEPNLPILWTKWDKDVFYFAPDSENIRALRVSDGSAVEVGSRKLKAIPYGISAANDYFADVLGGDTPGQTLIFQRYLGQAWRRAHTFPLPPASYGGVVWGMNAENLVLSLFTNRDTVSPADFSVLTSSRKNGQWQAPKPVPLTQTLRTDYLNMVAMEDNTMLLAVTRNFTSTNDADTALVVRTASGEWRFIRWLGLPARGYNVAVAIAGPYAARLGYEHPYVPHHVEVQKLTGMDVYDGPIGEDTHLVSSSSFNWGGQVLQGVETRRTLTLINSGTSSYPVQARIEGSHAADFQLSGMPTGALQPAAEATLTLTVKPSAVGLRDARLVLTPGTPDLPEWVLDLDAMGTSIVIGPETPQSVEYVILERGREWLYRPVFTNTRPMQIEWRKDGHPLSNANQDFLRLPSVQPGDAGEYEARATNSAGSASVRVHIAVYENLVSEVPVRSSAPLKLPARFWGAGTVTWSVPDVPAVYSGRRSPTLHVLAPVAALNTAVYGSGARIPTATLQLGSASQVIARHYLVPRLPPRIVRVPSGDREVRSGEDGSVEAELITDGWYQVYATGLPLGMSVDGTTGSVYGKFNTVGTYTVTWRARNDYGEDAVTSVFRVSATPRRVPPAGTYAGLIGDVIRIGGLEMPSAHLMVQMGEGGFFTCQFRYKNTVRRFSSRFVPSDEFGGEPAAILPLGRLSSGARDAVLRLEPIYDTNAGSFRASLLFKHADGTAGDRGGDIVRAFRLMRQEQELYTGDFASLLQPPPGAPEQVPQGTGICSLRVSADGTSASGAGTLADGTVYTFGSALTPGTIPVYFYDAATLNGLFGWMPVTTSSSLTWTRPGDGSRRLYPDPFEAILNIQFMKRRGSPAGKLLLADVAAGPLNARMTARWNSTNVVDTAFTLTSAHQAAFPAPNVNRVSIDFYAPTGFFTGKFNVPGEGTTTRTVRITGMMLPDLNIGGGFFVLPKLAEPNGAPATTSANSPILSGRITIAPETMKR